MTTTISGINGVDNIFTGIMGNFTGLLSGNGYVKIPVNEGAVKKELIIQWGSTTAASVTFPIAFPTGVLARQLVINDWNSTGSAAAQYTAITAISNTGFTVAAASGGAAGNLRWIALGY